MDERDEVIMDTVYQDLVVGLVKAANLNMFQARKVIAYLEETGHLDILQDNDDD